MNTVITLLLCITIFSTTRSMTLEEKEALQGECQAKTGVTEETLQKAMKGDIPEDQNFKDHVFCFSRKMGVQNDAGEFQLDVMKPQLLDYIQDEAKVDELISKCTATKSTPEETAYENFICLHSAKNS